MKLITEIVSDSQKIFVNQSTDPLVEKIIQKITEDPHLDICQAIDGSWNVMIYLSGQDDLLHQYLKRAAEQDAKFLLVVSKLKSPVGRVARTIVEQFAKKNNLDYLVVETGEVSPTAAAVQIIHLLGNPSLLHPPGLFKNLKTWVPLISLLLIPLLLVGGGELLFVGARYCVKSSLENLSWSRSVACARILTPTSKLILDIFPSYGPALAANSLGQTVLQANVVLESLLPYGLALVRPGVSAPEGTENLTRELVMLGEKLAQLQLTAGQDRHGQVRQLVTKLNVVSPHLPQLLSLAGQTQWLLLLQDDTELRPTGGFIAGIGLVTLDNGYITTARFFPTGQADAQLTGQVEPPADLAELAGESSWYLRDSNWDSDFPTSAAQSVWFVERELGQSVDAVAAVNLTTLAGWLKVTGPVGLDSGTQVNTDNWRDKYYELLKKGEGEEFIPQLAEKISFQVQSLSDEKLAQLFAVIAGNLETRQLLLWPLTFSGSYLKAVGWSGQVGRTSCPSPYPCVSDYIYQVDANVGVNKVDPYIDRNLTMSFEIGKQTVNARYTMTYAHPGGDTAWPRGEYKNYVRIYLPATAQDVVVEVDGQKLSLGQIRSRSVGELVEMGFLVLVATGKTVKLDLSWYQITPRDPRWHHQLELVNQPGVQPYPVQVEIKHPGGWWSQTGLDPQFAQSGHIGYNFPLDRPRRINLDLVPSQ